MTAVEFTFADDEKDWAADQAEYLAAKKKEQQERARLVSFGKKLLRKWSDSGRGSFRWRPEITVRGVTVMGATMVHPARPNGQAVCRQFVRATEHSTDIPAGVEICGTCALAVGRIGRPFLDGVWVDGEVCAHNPIDVAYYPGLVCECGTAHRYFQPCGCPEPCL